MDAAFQIACSVVQTVASLFGTMTSIPVMH